MTSREGAPTPVGDPIPSSGKGFSRRTLLRRVGALGAVIGAGALGSGGTYLWDSLRPPETVPTFMIGADFIAPFEGQQANDAAKGLGITAGTFFIPNPEDPLMLDIKKKIAEHKTGEMPANLFTKESVLPIFPPSVLDLVHWMEQIAETVPQTRLGVPGKDIKFPVNVAATVCTIESAGILNADSHIDPQDPMKNAHGPMQVVPDSHIDDIFDAASLVQRGIGLTGDDVRQWKNFKDAKDNQGATDFIAARNVQDKIISALEDPFVGIATGMLILKKYYDSIYSDRQSAQPDVPLNPYDPEIWEKTLVNYNAGPGHSKTPYEQLPRETQRYQLMASRFFMTGELASEMVDAGLGPSAIGNQLRSSEIDGRAYAYNMLKLNHPVTDLQSRSFISNSLATRTIIDTTLPPQILTDMQGKYTEYIESYNAGTDSFPRQLPLNPGIRMYLAEIGEGQFNKDPRNLSLLNYPSSR